MAQKHKSRRNKWEDASLGEKLTLLGFIALWVFLAAVTFIGICYGFLGSMIWDLHPETKNILEVVRISLTIVGGIGAVGYLVIKYQERQAGLREERRTVNQLDRRRFGEAIALFGSENTITRMAGVHALIEVGNADPSLQQEIINLLCGYLRSKRDQDNVCESHILKLLHGALSGYFGVEWRDDLFLDLHGAECVENFYLSDCTILGMNLNGATFNSGFTLDNITISGTFQCSRAHFNKYLNLRGCTFEEGADFSGIHVSEATLIERTKFNSQDKEEEQNILTKTGSPFKTHKEQWVDLAGAEFLGWLDLKHVEFNTDCLLAAPANFDYFMGKPGTPATFGTSQKEGAESSVSLPINFSAEEVTFNEILLVDGVNPMFLSYMGSSVTISRKDVEDYIDEYIKRTQKTQVR
ncbi:hypothetical protein [Bifidobacterium mongoliense]|nr:hypothetical protein [Bifidobacterium mongoliense]